MEVSTGRSVTPVELGVCAWVSWLNEERIYSELGDRIPCKIEEDYSREVQATAA